MTEINIVSPKGIDCDIPQWKAEYKIEFFPSLIRLQITARSSIEVIVSKISPDILYDCTANYYISSPNFGIAIAGISSLQQTFWILEQLIHQGMPSPDAVTVAQILSTIHDESFA